MEKHGNKVRLTVNVCEEAARSIAQFQERFGCSASAVVEVCVLSERDGLRRVDKVLGPEGFNKLVKVLRWWAERPAPFENWTSDLKEVEG